MSLDVEPGLVSVSVVLPAKEFQDLIQDDHGKGKLHHQDLGASRSKDTTRNKKASLPGASCY